MSKDVTERYEIIKGYKKGIMSLVELKKIQLISINDY